MPVPTAVISAWISLFSRVLCRRAFSTLRILPRIGRTAWYAGSRAWMAGPAAESPSTMNSSVLSGSASWQSASLPGSVESRIPPLREDPLAVPAVLLEPRHQMPVDRGLDEGPHVGVAELRLRLALELGLLQLHRDDRGEPLADGVALEVGVLLLEEVSAARVAVDHVRQGLAQALLVGAALVGVDGVGEGVQGLCEAGVPLEGHLDLGVLLLAPEVNDPADRVLALVEERDEVGQAALGLVHLAPLAAAALVDQGDLHPAGQERQLPQPLGQDVPLELGLLEDLPVRPERDDRAGLPGGLALLQLLEPLAARVGLRPHRAVPCHLDVEPLGQRVHHRDTDPVEATGDHVRLAVELPAGVEGGKDDLDGRPSILRPRDRLHRDATAVVGHGDPAVGPEPDQDPGARPGQGLVDGVVHDLVHEVVEAPAPGGADVHAGPARDRLEALQDGDIRGLVTGAVAPPGPRGCRALGTGTPGGAGGGRSGLGTLPALLRGDRSLLRQ